MKFLPSTCNEITVAKKLSFIQDMHAWQFTTHVQCEHEAECPANKLCNTGNAKNDGKSSVVTQKGGCVTTKLSTKGNTCSVLR